MVDPIFRRGQEGFRNAPAGTSEWDRASCSARRAAVPVRPEVPTSRRTLAVESRPVLPTEPEVCTIRPTPQSGETPIDMLAWARHLRYRALSAASAIDRSVDPLLWRAGVRGPEIDLAKARAHLERLGIPSDGTTRAEGGRLLVHVAFHFAPNRLKYLFETVRALEELPFRDIDIVIDTNTEVTRLRTQTFFTRRPVRYAVWRDLEDPFKLTWMHRKGMAAAAGAYDTYLYVEDDIIIPPTTAAHWLERQAELAGVDAFPGFVRVEEDRAGQLMLSDFQADVHRDETVTVNGRRYLDTPYPYQACWIASAAQLDWFMAQKSWDEGCTYPDFFMERDGYLGVRECVAYGFTFDEVPAGRRSRALVALGPDGGISPEAIVFHAPCNYARSRYPNSFGLGRLPFEAALRDGPERLRRTA